MKKTKMIAFVGLSAAVICVLGPLSIPLPFSPVPISLTLFAVYMAAYANGFKLGTAAVGIYILLGLIGIPVFSGFSGGAGKLFGPTGGYIFGYLLSALIAGIFIEKAENKYYMHFIGMIIGTLCCYILGTLWLAKVASLGFKAALFAGVIPFIPADIVKIIAAGLVGIPLRKALKKLS